MMLALRSSFIDYRSVEDTERSRSAACAMSGISSFIDYRSVEDTERLQTIATALRAVHAFIDYRSVEDTERCRAHSSKATMLRLH